MTREPTGTILIIIIDLHIRLRIARDTGRAHSPRYGRK